MTVQVKNGVLLFWREKKLCSKTHSLQNAKQKKLTRMNHGAAGHGLYRHLRGVESIITSWPAVPWIFSRRLVRIRSSTTNSCSHYTMARAAWVAPSDKSNNMQGYTRTWSCGPPAYSIIRWSPTPATILSFTRRRCVAHRQCCCVWVRLHTLLTHVDPWSHTRLV